MLTIAMLMLAQQIGPPGDEPPPPRTAVTHRRWCDRRDDAIVVCGGGQDSQRLLELPVPGTQPVFGPAATRVAPNKTLSASAGASGNAQLPAPRAMINFKLDF